MKLDVIRFQYGKDATNSLLFIDDEFEAYGLEDEHRDVKVMHETCIPEGTYKIKLRTVGGFHTKYAAKYGDFHKGMIHVQDVPGFEFILLHTGNTDQHTSGCYIIGETQQDLDKGKDGFVGNSGTAYKKMYPKVADAILAGEEVTIKYTHIKDLIDLPEVVSDLRGQVKILESAAKGRPII
mgnify:CR=1 FL=1